MPFDSRLEEKVKQHPFPLLFVTISGAHLYGFPSDDSDYDLRGAHLLPVNQVLGLKKNNETFEKTTVDEGLEIDLVTHDVRKFFGMLLKKNGYVMEQVFSPLVLRSSPEHQELKEIAARCLTKHHAHHYLGFAETQWRLFQKHSPHRIKPLLYVFRVLLTGIHLMKSGEVEANIETLLSEFKYPFLKELVEKKRSGSEKEPLVDEDFAFYRETYESLQAELESAHKDSHLPEQPAGSDDLNDLLVRIRLSRLNAE